MELIKVMIVDDERLALDYIRNMIPWEEHGYTIVAEATNGIKALELYKKYSPEILIVDIRMPGMDGIQLSKELVSCGERKKIIFLTAYKDFEYAKSAVEIGVSNYILKHEINAESLLKELGKAREELEKEKEREQLIRTQLIRQIIKGTYNDEPQMDFEGELIKEIGPHIAVLLIKLDSPYPVLNVSNDNTTKNTKLLSSSIKGIDYLCYGEVCCKDIIDLDDESCIVLASLRSMNSRQGLYQQINPIIARIQKEFRKKTATTVSVSVALTGKGIKGLPKAFQKATQTIKYSIFQGREAILWLENIPVMSNHSDRLSSAQFNSIKKDLDEMGKVLSEMRYEAVQRQNRRDFFKS